MKKILRKLFSPILNLFETGNGAYNYKKSHRLILISLGLLFCSLATAVLWFAWGQDPMYFLPVIIFGGAGLVSLIIGSLGSDQAVAKIWGSR